MKRPASVTAAIVVLALFSFAAIYMVVAMFQRGTPVQAAVQVVILVLCAAPIYGLVTRRNWARIYSSVLFILLAVGMLVGNASMAQQENLIVVLIYGGIVAGLLLWNVAALMSKDVKQYFVLAATK